MSAQYYADRAWRMARERGYVGDTTSRTFAYLTPENGLPQGADWRHAYLLEELITALTSQDRKLAFRALLQATRTLQSWGRENNCVFESDALRMAQDRVESLLGLEDAL